MAKGRRRLDRRWLVAVISVSLGIIVCGALVYIHNLGNKLKDQDLQNVLDVTKQQQQAFDTFISQDKERLRSYAEYFEESGSGNLDDIEQLLALFGKVDASVAVMCLDEGWACGTSTDGIWEKTLTEDELEVYSALEGSGTRVGYPGLHTGTSRFGYYESFLFPNGHRGLVQKSYEQSRIAELFSLSFYGGQGWAYVVDKDGNILVRPSVSVGQEYDNLFDALVQLVDQKDEIDRFREALRNDEQGSADLVGYRGELIYTYAPIGSVDGWFLISVVPSGVISAAADAILRGSQMAVAFLALVLVICVVFVILIWRTQQDLKSKDTKIEYQTQLFNIFSEHLARSSDDVFIMLDEETREIEFVSENVERVMGVAPADLHDYFDTSDKALAPELSTEFYDKVAVMPPGETLSRNTERVNPRTGERRYFRESAYCVELQGRRKRVYYISDRTEERKDRRNLIDALHMAKAASEAKSSFLSSVSHDIRTPMNAIIGFLELMRDEAGDRAAVMDYIGRIDAASQHLLNLINDVLDMNKIESGSTTLSLAEMSLAEIIDEINTIIRPQTKAKRQTFDIFVASIEYEHLKGDKLRINQVLINLLSNAVKYTPEGGNIQLRVEECPQVVNNYSRIRFVVSDNGMGMSEDYLKVIFDPFTREEDNTAVHEAQGTGLGMAITKSLVDLMDGTIRVESRVGEGSTFTVELELYIQETEETDIKFWLDHKVTRMIVADDDEDVCRGIVKAMSKTGVEVKYATSGEAAVRMMHEARDAGKPHDLILLDWKMPDLDGLGTARMIRKDYADEIPILLLTAYDWSDIEQEAKEIGIDHFMPKPFFMTNFKEVIRRVMGSQKAVNETGEDIVKGRHILVVDDIEVNRIILVKILTTLGAKCDVAGDGKEAVEAFERSQPGDIDMILMDVQMPVMDGYAATRAIRASAHPSAKTMPIIAMTANAFVDDVREAIESGMDAHVAKPIQVDKLKTTIRQVLESREEDKQ
ncbi:MAG: response regulator [Butyricicoccus sp.]|nr:response regulator [Butyricicoccus sp.]MCM1232979.1 response regulator [Ruminococcus flavefaciens]